MVEVDWNTSFVVADIPGLIEGAADGIGLGHDFLKHIERSGILVHLVEPEPIDGTNPIQNYHAIRRELEKYNSQLLLRPEIIVITKADLPSANSVQRELAEQTKKTVQLISAVVGHGVQELVHSIANVLNKSNELALEDGINEREHDQL